MEVFLDSIHFNFFRNKALAFFLLR